MNKKSKDRVCTVIVLCYELVFAAASGKKVRGLFEGGNK